MNAKKKIRRVADEECVLDAAEIVVGEEYIDRTPFEHLHNHTIRAELKRAGFARAEVRPDRHSSRLKIFWLGC